MRHTPRALVGSKTTDFYEQLSELCDIVTLLRASAPCKGREHAILVAGHYRLSGVTTSCTANLVATTMNPGIEGRKLSESQLRYTTELQEALVKRNARIASLEADLEKLERTTLDGVRHEAWALGQRHEVEHLARLGQFCPRGDDCNPFGVSAAS